MPEIQSFEGGISVHKNVPTKPKGARLVNSSSNAPPHVIGNLLSFFMFIL